LPRHCLSPEEKAVKAALLHGPPRFEFNQRSGMNSSGAVKFSGLFCNTCNDALTVVCRQSYIKGEMTCSGIYCPPIDAPPLGATRCRPHGTGGLIRKAAIRWIYLRFTFLDHRIEIRQRGKPSLSYLLHRSKLSTDFLT
jgi:hypothetical protein